MSFYRFKYSSPNGKCITWSLGHQNCGKLIACKITEKSFCGLVFCFISIAWVSYSYFGLLLIKCGVRMMKAKSRRVKIGFLGLFHWVSQKAGAVIAFLSWLKSQMIAKKIFLAFAHCVLKISITGVVAYGEVQNRFIVRSCNQNLIISLPKTAIMWPELFENVVFHKMTWVSSSEDVSTKLCGMKF